MKTLTAPVNGEPRKRLYVLNSHYFTLSPRRRDKIYKRDKYICQYCGTYLSKRQRTIDHIVPRSKGSCSCDGNLVTCCINCNRTKADRTPEEAGIVRLKVNE